MDNSTVECDLHSDYEFMEETDVGYEDGIVVMGNTTINGNNHIIDCKNKALAFTVNQSVLYLNDLTIKNGNPNMIYMNTGKCILNNVNFTDDNNANSLFKNLIVAVDDSDFIQGASRAELNITNCIFYSTTVHAVDIWSYSAIVNIKDSVFDGGQVTGRGHVSANAEAELNIDNVTFTNLTSKYATAIYAETYLLNIKNSRFINLYSNLTAGAVGIKYSNFHLKKQSYVIENCIFENTGCLNDGGAVFFDAGVQPEDENVPANTTLNIIDSHFTGCTASFGGAVVQLGGYLNIVNSTFDENIALSDGGAIYTSIVSVNITNSTFTNNSALNQGGAIFQDDFLLDIKNSTFKGNKVVFYTADSANTIYSYNSGLNIENSYFKNSGMSIYGVFCEFSENNNTYLEDEVSTDNLEYEYYAGFPADAIKLLNNTINVENLPSRFDLRDWGWVSPVENQGNLGVCWAFGSISAFESALRKAAGINYTFSVNNLYSMELMYSKYGSSAIDEGGYIMNGCGICSKLDGASLQFI